MNWKILYLLSITSLNLFAAGWKFEGGGAFKSIASFQRLRQTNLFPHDAVAVTEQRFRLRGSASYRWFYAEFADEASLFAQEVNEPRFPLPSTGDPSWWNTESHLVDKTWLDIYQKVDRAFVQFNLDPVEIILGKQVISLGVGKVFGAITQVQRQPFVIVDPEYPRTEDAATVTWKGPMTLEARFLPKLRTQKDHNFHVRAKGNKSEYDVALTAGRSDDKIFIGLETAGNLGDALLYGELAGYDLRGHAYLQGLLGVDQALSPKWKYLAEIFFNGFGKEKREYRVEKYLHRSSPYRGRLYGALSVTWDTTERLKTNLLTIANVADPSFLVNLFWGYSLGNSTEIMWGQFLSLGDGASEFGGTLPFGPLFGLGLPDLSYAAFKWYF